MSDTKKPKKKGAPTKLTKTVQRKYCAGIRLGLSRERCALYAGISVMSVHRWLKAGESAKSGVQRDFYLAVKKAEADGLAGYLGVIQKAAFGYTEKTVKEVNKINKVTGEEYIERTVTTCRKFSWQAAAWWLERKFPDEWALLLMIRRMMEDGELDEMAGPLILLRDPKAYEKKDDDGDE